MTDIWSFHSANKLIFGSGSLAQLAPLAERRRWRRALVVTDRPLVDVGLVAKLEEVLAAGGVQTTRYEECLPEPDMEIVAGAVTQAKDTDSDVIVGFGGGSNMDVAKMASALVTHGGHPRDYAGENRLPGPVHPLVCIPTTAGTGSEVSFATILTDSHQQVKVGILDNLLRPQVAIVDPLLTLSCPPKVTADSGIDALVHAIEAYTAVDNQAITPGEGEPAFQGTNPLGDILAEKAIRLIGANLETAVSDGQNLAAREAMALGATLAGMAFSNVGVALVHAMEYPLGAMVHCSHGEGNGLLLPYVMRFNYSARPERFAKLAEWLLDDASGLDQESAFQATVERIEAMQRNIGIRTKLSDMGVDHKHLGKLAEKAFNIKRMLRVNPRPASCEDIQAIYESAL